MTYRMPGSCKICSTQYTQVSGIDVSVDDQRRLSWHYSCPKCGSQEFYPSILSWNLPIKSDLINE